MNYMVIKNKLFSQTNRILLAGIILSLMVSFIGFNSAFATDYVLSDQTSCEAAPFLGTWSGNECIIVSVIINPTDRVTINPSTHLIGGDLWVNSTLTNYGEIVAEDMYIDWNGNFVNEGTVTITDTGSIEVDGILTNNSVFNSFEAVVLVADCPFCQGIITNNNSMYLEQLFNQGVLINSVDKVLTFNATNTNIINQVNGIITNYGEIIIITPHEGASFVNDSEFSNEIGGTVTIIDDGIVNIDGSFINENSGLFTNNNTFTINETFLNYSLLENSGTINNQITGTINNQITGTINNTGIINNNCGIVINDGIFIGNSIIEIFCDSDNDSISNLIDIQSDTFSNDFSDMGIFGTTSGTITTRGDQILTISEEPNPDGVRISADISGGSTPASFSVCDGASTFSVNAGDEVIVTCSSVILNVVTGQVIATFIDTNSNTATATIDQNSTLIFKPDTFTIESTGGTSDVTFVNDDGTTVTTVITEDNLVDFDAETFTFSAGQNNTSDIVIFIDGEISTLSTATSLSLLSTNRDSFITQGSSSNNEGSNLILRIMSSDKNRPLVGFDQQQILLSSNDKILQSATLRMYITTNDNNWGSSGKTIGAYKLNSDWIEGNGWNVDNNVSGSGTGVTWSCNVDSNISNNQKDCAVQWDGGNFNLPPTNTMVITNSMINQWIEFDVTADVQGFLSGTDSNYGWLIKKTGDDSLNGSIEFASKESGLHKSELKLVFQE